MKNIIIAGPGRTGKSTLARKINQELNYFVVGLDKLVAIFGEAYPKLDIRLNWNYEKTRTNLSPFIGHFLGMFSSTDGRGLLPYSHGAVKGNRFVLEGSYFKFEEILPILESYGVKELNNDFLLIGLVQKEKSVDEFVHDFKKYDTEADWTYGFNDDDLRELSESLVEDNRYFYSYLLQYSFTVYDTSRGREHVLDQILEDIKPLIMT